jgi:hypothetical protein
MLTEQPNFANKCKNILEALKTDKKNDTINGNYNRNWADTLIRLAENQVIIAEYMAQQTEEQRKEKLERAEREEEMALFTSLVMVAGLFIAITLVYLISQVWFIGA